MQPYDTNVIILHMQNLENLDTNNCKTAPYTEKRERSWRETSPVLA